MSQGQGGGRPRLSAEEKARRGTLEEHREREFHGRGTAPKGKRGRKPKEQALPARDYLAEAERYSAEVLAGKIPTCRLLRQAVLRQQKDLKRTDWPYVWSPKEATAVCQFVERL